MHFKLISKLCDKYPEIEFGKYCDFEQKVLVIISEVLIDKDTLKKIKIALIIIGVVLILIGIGVFLSVRHYKKKI